MIRSRAGETEAAYLAALPGIVARSNALVGPSLVERFCALPEADRSCILADLSPLELHALKYTWAAWARPKQLLPPGDWWRWWVYAGGVGSGKSLAAQQATRFHVDAGVGTIGIVGPTIDFAEKVMLGYENPNEDGLLWVWPKSQRPRYHKADGVVEFHTGALGYLLSGEQPDLRGYNLGWAWMDEASNIRDIARLARNLNSRLRKPGPLPCRGVITSNVKDDFPWLKEMFARPNVYVTVALTTENASNVDPGWLADQLLTLSGTVDGARELGWSMDSDSADKLFRLGDIDTHRIAGLHRMPRLREACVSIDPALSNSSRADEVGMSCVGISEDAQLYVWGDRTAKMTPREYGDAAIDAYLDLVQRAERVFVLVEDNRVGMHAAENIRAAAQRRLGELAGLAVRIETVHAEGRKDQRAADGPAQLYGQGAVHHVGQLPNIEAELTGYKRGDDSPNGMDTVVHAIRWLAKLGEATVDHRAGFVGLAEANAAIGPWAGSGAATIGAPAVNPWAQPEEERGPYL